MIIGLEAWRQCQLSFRIAQWDSMWITGVEYTNLAKNSTCSNNHAKRESCPKSWRANEGKVARLNKASLEISHVETLQQMESGLNKNLRIFRPGILCFSFPTLSPPACYFFPPLFSNSAVSHSLNNVLFLSGVKLTLSTLIDGKNFSTGGHKIGLGFELEA